MTDAGEGKKEHMPIIPLERVEGIGHGTHWFSVHEDFNAIKPFLISTVKLENLTKFSVEPFGDLGESSIAGHKGDIHERISTMMVLGEENGKRVLATGYPVLWSEKPRKFLPKKIHEWPSQIECFVEARIGEEMALTFFPVDFFFRRRWYLADEVKEVALGMFAYDVVVNPFEGRTVNDGTRDLAMNDAQVIMPLNGGAPDDYRLIGKLKRIDAIPVFENRGYILTIDCGPLKDFELFALEQHMKAVPSVGDMVGVAGWMQGRDASVEYNVMGPD